MDKELLMFLLNELPKYISLFYPGYITIYLYFFFCGKNFKDSSWIVAKTIFISYLYNIACRSILEKSEHYSEMNMNVALLVLAIAIGVVAAKIRDSKKFEEILNRIKDDTVFQEDEFEILRNEDRSAWVCIYLKGSNVVYEGSLGNRELEAGRRQFITLEAFYKYRLDKKGYPKEPYIEDHEGNYEEKVVIFYDSIKRIEKRDTRGSVQTSAEEPAC